MASPQTHECQLVADTVRELCGMDLGPSKGYLIESRLGPLIEQFELKDYEDLCRRARDIAQSALRAEVISRITTHETLFFRDVSLFSALKNKILPEIFDAVDKRCASAARVWSAACSTGQEPYSVAMIAHDLLNMAGRRYALDITATDVSEPTVRTAAEGFYHDFETERCGIPGVLERYSQVEGQGRRINAQLRSECTFRALDLQREFSLLGQFDLILCRNVLIYFDSALRHDILTRMAQRLTPGGSLVVGATENLLDMGDLYAAETHCGSTFYKRR